MKDDLPHRDDFPMEVVEKFTQKIQEQHPGARLLFAGDIPGEIPEYIKEASQRMHDLGQHSIREGVCVSCQIKFPSQWPTKEMVDDWLELFDRHDNLAAIICPNCQKNCMTV